MSRVPPFPSARRAQTPSTSEYDYGPPSPNTTRPLQINRPPRPTTPSRSAAMSSSPSGPGPARPPRSGLRSRKVSEYTGSDRLSIDSNGGDYRDQRDSIDTSRSDSSQPPPRPPRSNISGTPAATNGHLKPPPSRSPTSPEELSPSSMAVLAMFQSVMQKKRRGMTDDDYLEAEYEKEKEKELAIQQVRQRRLRERMPGRKATETKAGDIDAVLDEIKDEWEMVINPDFNPVDLALQLLSDSSLGKDMESFRQTKNMLSRALKGSVDKNYQAFAAALPHHASLLNHLGGIQGQIGEARTALQEAKEALGSKRGDLVQLWSRSQTVEDMLRILDRIEHLRSVPDALESLISEKRLLQAAVLLVRSIKLINKQDMLDIGALSDLRGYLSSQETSLCEILIDELHSHLYLRSFWCDSRWAVYIPNQQTFPVVEFEKETNTVDPLKIAIPSTPISPSSRSTRLSRFLDDLSLRPNDSPLDVDEQSLAGGVTNGSLQASGSMQLGLLTAPSRTSLTDASSTNGTIIYTPTPNPVTSNRNPEADSFTYIESLLESLAVLGKLGHALDIVAQKVPQEIFTLVETTREEVEERAEYGRRSSLNGSIGAAKGFRIDNIYLSLSGGAGSMVAPGALGVSVSSSLGASPTNIFVSASALRLAALELSTKRGDQEIMRDFFWTLYSKLDAVAQGLRIVYEVSNRIGSRRDFKDSSGAKPGALFPLAEIWMPIQAEVRTLLNDYITDEEQGVVSGRNPISSINEVLREGRYLRDKSKPVFRFADTDLKFAAKILRDHEDELTRVLKATVPGLVQGSAESAVQATLSAVGTDDRLGSGQHHRLLVHPDAFHVTVLFQPTLTFLDRIAEVLPFGHEAGRTSSAVLDEFVLKVYLPQLEDKVSDMFHQAVTSPDAFQADSISTRLSPQPLVKASVQLMALINSLCAMLRTTPFHRESYARLILTVIVQFYQRCSDRFQDLVSLKAMQDEDGTSHLALAAHWAQKSELIPCLAELLAAGLDDAALSKKLQLCSQESHLESNLLGERTVAKDELIMSTKNLASLSSLYHSVTWFASELNALKQGSDIHLSPTTPLKLEPLSATTPFTPHMPSPLQPHEQLKLPLSNAMAMRFQALLKTYEQLSESILYTVRSDIRCRVMHHLDLALRHGHYSIDREASEPDPHIVDLNAELAKCDDFASSTLPEKERRNSFVFDGLSHLMESLLITNAKYLRAINTHGVKKMLRSILALQQNIRTIAQESRHADFERAKRYYSLFALSPRDLLDTVRQKQEFSFDEYKVILDLQCGVDPSQGEKAAGQASDRNYNMYLIELHGLELERSTEDNE
ncbi:hypothetical protein NM688_g3000 [Phlebia brevispora]|uniref:Uncharacterized protein n=1 Tax=Phlebia brevispora TaxID=194682 RepID=A0ACC1T6S4_9APHY|nr:hypothetical protein NM688_g3000 [Phlebia brevispora]